MARTLKNKELINTRLATNYGGWMYCDTCNENIGYLCYSTYDRLELEYECMCGNGIKAPVDDEVKNRRNNRKSVITICDIKEGEIFTEKNLDVKRPGIGIEPQFYEKILGKRALRDLKKDTMIHWSDIGYVQER